MMNLIRLMGLIGCAALVAACGKEAVSPMRVGTVQWPGYEPLYLARTLEYFNESQVKLIEHTATTETIDAYRNEAIDLAGLTLDEVLRLKQQGKDVKIILAMDVSNGADVIVARQGITSMQGLKGKRVGVEANALGAYMLGRGLELAGMKPADIRIVPLQFSEHESAFLQKKVDAVVTFDPGRTKLLKQGGTVVFDSSRIPNEIVAALVVRPDYLEKNRDKVRQLVNAWYRALDYLGQHREEAARHMAARHGISPEEFLDSLDGLKLISREENERLIGGSAPQIKDTLRRLNGLMKDKGLLEGDVNLDDLVDPGVLH